MTYIIIIEYLEITKNWFINNWIEFFAALLGFIGIFLQIKQNAWYWLTSIIMVVLYIHVFYISGFYADMSFQFYYLAMSIYGWYYWIKHKKKKIERKKEIYLLVNTINKKQFILYLLIGIILWVIIYIILLQTDSEIPLGDSFTTAFSIVASFLLAKKYLENWIFWIIVDFVSSFLYFYKELFMTAILFLFLTILAIIGYIKWKNNLKNQEV